MNTLGILGQVYIDIDEQQRSEGLGQTSKKRSYLGEGVGEFKVTLFSQTGESWPLVFWMYHEIVLPSEQILMTVV